uniref:Uncharacterized protein n=1 Tax=Schistosoma haematobium TaxID=6185 RepID=A0A094ZUP7_SCHHA
MNYNKRSKRNEKRNKRKNQFNHIRLHSYDESIKADLNDNSYYEDGEFGTDITYLPLSEFNNSMDQLKISNKTIDDTALVHSVFAVVAARLRKKHNGSKGFIKKVSEYEKLGQNHYDNSTTNNRNIHESKSKSHQTSKQIHQHIKLASYTSNDLTKQAKYKEMNNNDEQQSWHLCIKWNPNHLSNQSTFNSINIHDQNKTLSNKTTHQLKLKKTHILATLGTEIDKTSLWNNNNFIDSLLSANIHGLDQIDRQQQQQQQNYTQNHYISQYKDHINRKSIICSICQHLIDHNSKDPILPYLDNNQFAITDQTIDDQKFINRYRISFTKFRHRSYNHHYYHRSSSQPQTKHERIIQNHLPKNHRCNHNDEYRTSLEQTFMNNDTNNNNIQCSNIQHRIQFNQQSCKRQSKHRHKRTKQRAKSYLPIHRLLSNDINNQVNDSSAKSNHYKLESYKSQKQIDHQSMMNKNDKFIVDPSLDLNQRLIHLKQDHKFKRYNRKYLGQLNVQEWLNKTLTNNY